MSLLNKGKKKLRFIEQRLSALERVVREAQDRLFWMVMDDFAANLIQEQSRILNNSQNIRSISHLDKVYEDFTERYNLPIVKTVVQDMDKIVNNNTDYFKDLSPWGDRLFQATSKDIQSAVNRRLGLDEKGKLIRNGYMMGLLDDRSVLNEIKTSAYRGILTGSGFIEMRRGLSDLIKGNKDKLGSFNRFYRNYSFDTYNQVDAMNGKMWADKLDLKYFIYNGGLIKTSRCFCINRNGNVYTTEEAKDWNPSNEENPCSNKYGARVSVPANYNFFIDRGSHGCRHSIDYIDEKLAKRLRPDLNEEKPADKPKETPKAAPEKNPAREINLENFIAGDIPTNKEVSEIMFAFADLMPENFRRHLESVKFAKSRSYMMQHSMSYETRTGNWVSGSRITISTNDFSIGGTTFNPANELKSGLAAIKSGNDLTFNQEYAFEALWHEILHAKSNTSPRRVTGDRLKAMETVNQFVARHTYDTLIEALGGRANHKQKILDEGYGYRSWVADFRNKLKSLGVSEQTAIEELEGVLMTDYSKVQIELLKFYQKYNR